MKAHLLRSLYPRVIDGLPVLGTPHETVARHTQDDGLVDTTAMIRRYTVLSGATGFVTGVPGFLMLPVVLPANLVGNAALQLHMTAAVALVGGQDPLDPRVEEECIACLLDQFAGDEQNDEAEELTKRTGVKLGERLVRLAARRGARHLAQRVGRRIGFRRLPVLGGVLGASADATLTRHVAHCATRRFLEVGRSPAVS